MMIVFCLNLVDLGFVFSFQLPDDRKDVVFYRLRVIMRDFVLKLVKKAASWLVLVVSIGASCF